MKAARTRVIRAFVFYTFWPAAIRTDLGFRFAFRVTPRRHAPHPGARTRFPSLGGSLLSQAVRKRARPGVNGARSSIEFHYSNFNYLPNLGL